MIAGLFNALYIILQCLHFSGMVNYMHDKINDYAQSYIALSSQLCKKSEEYTPERVLIHNRNIKKLDKLRAEIACDISIASAVYKILLKHPDPYIRQSAATVCLIHLKIHTDESVKVLQWVCRHGDRMAKMGAKMNLLIWSGQLNADRPF